MRKKPTNLGTKESAAIHTKNVPPHVCKIIGIYKYFLCSSWSNAALLICGHYWFSLGEETAWERGVRNEFKRIAAKNRQLIMYNMKIVRSLHRKGGETSTTIKWTMATVTVIKDDNAQQWIGLMTITKGSANTIYNLRIARRSIYVISGTGSKKKNSNLPHKKENFRKTRPRANNKMEMGGEKLKRWGNKIRVKFLKHTTNRWCYMIIYWKWGQSTLKLVTYFLQITSTLPLRFSTVYNFDQVILCQSLIR